MLARLRHLSSRVRARLLVWPALGILAIGAFALPPAADVGNAEELRACALSWADEFDGAGLPSADAWRYDVGAHGWGNQELQDYTAARPENARVEDGRLIIEARREPSPNGAEYTSSRLLSTREWTYGRFEVRAKLPSGRGTWPAIWMLPDLPRYGGWPRGGEIDIMEHVGWNPDVVHASVHTQAYHHSIGTQRTARVRLPDARAAFHTYAIDWSPEAIRGYIDGDLYFMFANERRADPDADDRHWPFDHPFHFVLNVAVGGSWGGQQGVDPEIWPQRMEVDWVRVYDCGDS